MDICNISITGRLTRDAELKTIPSGKTYVNADVATNTGFGDKQKVTYFKIQFWGQSGTNLLPYLTKGSLVGCAGSFKIDEWTNADGKKYTSNIIDTQSLALLKAATKNETDKNDVEDVAF